MQKTTLYILLGAILCALGLGYAVGLFDGPSSSVSVSTTPSQSTAVQTSVQATTPTPTATTPTAKKTITATEVAQHSSKGDCWMIITGTVYNFTSYITQHPGGQSVIVGSCGKDGTAIFASERKHTRPEYLAQLATYALGALQK